MKAEFIKKNNREFEWYNTGLFSESRDKTKRWI